MPCVSGPTWEQQQAENDYSATLKGGLCAALGFLRDRGLLEDFFNHVDWREVGLDDKSVKAWWAKHQEEDRFRRMQEKQRALAYEVAQRALSKLTAEERKVLGL